MKLAAADWTRHRASTSTCWHFAFGLCCHSNETRAPIANPPNSAQLEGTPTIPPSYIRVRAVVWECGEGQTDTQINTQTHRCAWSIYVSPRLRLTRNEVMYVELIQVNESLLKSIVTQPWRDNYVYATGFDVLARVRNLVLDKACRVLVTEGSTTPTTPPRPTTTLSTILSTTPALIPSINGNMLVLFLPSSLVIQVEHSVGCVCVCADSNF